MDNQDARWLLGKYQPNHSMVYTANLKVLHIVGRPSGLFGGPWEFAVGSSCIDSAGDDWRVKTVLLVLLCPISLAHTVDYTKPVAVQGVAANKAPEFMECRSWEEMDIDCLTNIFGRLGIDDLAVLVPFVCQSWYRASLDPLCWRVLDFLSLDFMPWSDLTRRFIDRYSPPKFSFSGFMRFAIGRSSGAAVELKFPLQLSVSSKDIEFASNECPRLKSLVLSNLMLEEELHFPVLIGKWKDLEQLDMKSMPSSFSKMAAQISKNCTKFRALKMCGAIKEGDSHAFVKFLPNLRCLDLNRSYLPKEQLLAIMKGCKELENLRARDCVGFEADDEVLKYAAGIKTFEYERSKLSSDVWYDTDEEDNCDNCCVQIIC